MNSDQIIVAIKADQLEAFQAWWSERMEAGIYDHVLVSWGKHGRQPLILVENEQLAVLIKLGFG